MDVVGEGGEFDYEHHEGACDIDRVLVVKVDLAGNVVVGQLEEEETKKDSGSLSHPLAVLARNKNTHNWKVQTQQIPTEQAKLFFLSPLHIFSTSCHIETNPQKQIRRSHSAQINHK